MSNIKNIAFKANLIRAKQLETKEECKNHPHSQVGDYMVFLPPNDETFEMSFTVPQALFNRLFQMMPDKLHEIKLQSYNGHD